MSVDDEERDAPNLNAKKVTDLQVAVLRGALEEKEYYQPSVVAPSELTSTDGKPPKPWCSKENSIFRADAEWEEKQRRLEAFAADIQRLYQDMMEGLPAQRDFMWELIEGLEKRGELIGCYTDWKLAFHDMSEIV